MSFGNIFVWSENFPIFVFSILEGKQKSFRDFNLIKTSYVWSITSVDSNVTSKRHSSRLHRNVIYVQDEHLNDMCVLTAHSSLLLCHLKLLSGDDRECCSAAHSWYTSIYVESPVCAHDSSRSIVVLNALSTKHNARCCTLKSEMLC